MLTPSLLWQWDTDPEGLPLTSWAQLHLISSPSGLVPYVSFYSESGSLPQESPQLKDNIIFLFRSHPVSIINFYPEPGPLNFGTDVVLAGQTGRMTRVFLSFQGNKKSNKRQKQHPCIGHCFLPSVSEDEGEVEGEEGLGPRGKAGKERKEDVWHIVLPKCVVQRGRHRWSISTANSRNQTCTELQRFPCITVL